MDRKLGIAAAVAAGILGLAGGALTMHLADTHGLFGGGKSAATAGSVARADQGFAWPLFGKPRAADAPRAAYRPVQKELVKRRAQLGATSIPRLRFYRRILA